MSGKVTRDTDADGWWKIHAWNTDAVYGWGTGAEAERYAAILNRNQEVNTFEVTLPNPVKEQELEANPDAGFNLAEELQAREENDDAR